MPSSIRPTSDQSGACVVQHEITECGQPEGERDRHAGEHRRGDEADEEDHQVDVAEAQQHGAGAARTRAMITAIRPSAAASGTRRRRPTRRNSAITASGAKPTGSAAARQALEISSAGVVTGLSSAA